MNHEAEVLPLVAGGEIAVASAEVRSSAEPANATLDTTQIDDGGNVEAHRLDGTRFATTPFTRTARMR